MQKKQKSRTKFEKLMNPSEGKWRMVHRLDVFSLPPLPPGKSEYLRFDSVILPPDSSETLILDTIWDDEMICAFISDMEQQDWNYGALKEKQWTLNRGDRKSVV